MTTLCFFSATGGELTLVSQALARMRADGLDVTFVQADDADATDTNSGITINVTSSSGDAFTPPAI